MAQTGTEEAAAVMAAMTDWHDEGLDNFESLLHEANHGQQKQMVNASVASSQSQSHHESVIVTSNSQTNGNNSNNMMGNNHLPFSRGASRPNALDLTTTTMHSNMNGHRDRSVSPHHSPYQPNNSGTVFNYSVPHSMANQQAMHSPHGMHHSPHSPHYDSPASPHHRMSPAPMSPHHSVSPVSPHAMSNHSVGSVAVSSHDMMIRSPHSPVHVANPQPVSPIPHSPVSPHGMQMHSPVSPHARSVSPHHMSVGGPMSPYMANRSSSVSPVPRELSPAPNSSSVFGRYAASTSPLHGHLSSSQTTPDDENITFMNGVYDPMGMRKRHNSTPDKNSDLYKAKRERNNVAVRKSREKKKQREAETEARVKELTDENTGLQNKLDIVLKEMNLLKSLYKNIGVTLPAEARAKLEKELTKFN